MVLGLSLPAFTMLHFIISLIAIVTGLVVMFGLLGSKRLPGLTAIFLLFTILTSVTGFLFPFKGAVAVPYGRHPLAGSARDRLHRAVWREAFRGLAPDLCCDGDDFALSQYLRLDHPGVLESAGAAGACTGRAAGAAIWAGICRGAGHRAGVLRACHHRRMAPLQADVVRLIHRSAGTCACLRHSGAMRSVEPEISRNNLWIPALRP
jgi:hypothetical protein